MRQSRLALLFLAVGSLPALAADPKTEEAAVRVPLENYLKGHATGQREFMEKAFLPTAHIEGIRDGKFTSWTAAEYTAMFKGNVSPEEPQRRRWIEKVEITGTAAIATLQFDYPKSKITDYMLLLKQNGEWRIANKIYSSQPKP